VTGAVELLRRRESRRSRPDDGNAPPGAMRRRLGANPSFVERPVDDGLLDLLDRHGFIVDGENAGRFARGGTQATGELGKVVGGMQLLHGGLPVVARDEVVPLGDAIAQRASVVAEGDAAIHAP
jgi:hypothetical protein